MTAGEDGNSAAGPLGPSHLTNCWSFGFVAAATRPLDRFVATRRALDELLKERDSILVERITNINEFEHVASALKSFDQREPGLAALDMPGKCSLIDVPRGLTVWFAACIPKNGAEGVLAD